ncbi:MAG: M1 family metallopeptidase [Nitrospirota bacterium]
MFARGTVVWMVLSAVLVAGSELSRAAVAGMATIHHDLSVVLDPDQGRVLVEDAVTLPPINTADADRTIRFRLRAGWTPRALDTDVRLRRVEPAPDGEGGARVVRDEYAVALPHSARRFRVAYEGRVEPSDDPSANGAVTSDVVFLDGGSAWYPTFDDRLVTFTVEVRAPRDWVVVSQGQRTARRADGESGLVRWKSPEPQDDIFLVGGPLTEYTRRAGGVTAMALLRAPDPALAEQYLDATARYVAMYSALFGPYPYPKFAMVENAWETGYGMPSFTLLGSTVIRLPFILTSSYPHEILHNWWGNGVFVDSSGGNWAEGLTAYLADHLMAEQRGAGAAYRRAALQKYADYVTHERDFPLTEFRARRDSATEAVGYGKALMAFHMARRELGDDAFIRSLRAFFKAFRFHRATFTDLDQALAASADRTSMITPWVERVGAPALRVGGAQAAPLGDRFLLTALLEQTQPGAAYRLRVPVAVTLEGREDAYQTVVRLDTKRLGVELVVPGRPVRLDVDPEFDLFRRLDRAELPPALSQLFGAPRVAVIVPAAAPAELRAGYQRLAEAVAHSSEHAEIVSDETLERLPEDRAVWVLGWENRFRSAIERAASELPMTLHDSTARVPGADLARDGHAVVVAAHQPRNPEYGLGWIGCDRVEALPGLARKLPHYRTYGYLGFEGDEPTNVVKGEWPVLRSPLSVAVKQPDGSTRDAPRAKLENRRPLIAAEAGAN